MPLRDQITASPATQSIAQYYKCVHKNSIMMGIGGSSSHCSQCTDELSSVEAVANQEGPNDFLVAPKYLSFFSAVAVKKTPFLVQLEIFFVLLISRRLKYPIRFSWECFEI